MELPLIFPSSETITARLRMMLPALFAVMGMVRRETACVLLFFRRIEKVMAQLEQMLALFRAGELPVVTGAAPRREMLIVASPVGRVARRSSPVRAVVTDRVARDAFAPRFEVARTRVRWGVISESGRSLATRWRGLAVRWAEFTKMGLAGDLERRFKRSG